MFLRNAAPLPEYTASHPRRCYSSRMTTLNTLRIKKRDSTDNMVMSHAHHFSFIPKNGITERCVSRFVMIELYGTRHNGPGRSLLSRYHTHGLATRTAVYRGLFMKTIHAGVTIRSHNHVGIGRP
jgi:hypothetical protein